MAAQHSDIQTRVIDLSGVSLTELGRRDPSRLAQASTPLIQEVAASTTISLAGGQS
jgi:hypothetical protein